MPLGTAPPRREPQARRGSNRSAKQSYNESLPLPSGFAKWCKKRGRADRPAADDPPHPPHRPPGENPRTAAPSQASTPPRERPGGLTERYLVGRGGSSVECSASNRGGVERRDRERGSQPFRHPGFRFSQHRQMRETLAVWPTTANRTWRSGHDGRSSSPLNEPAPRPDFPCSCCRETREGEPSLAGDDSPSLIVGATISAKRGDSSERHTGLPQPPGAAQKALALRVNSVCLGSSASCAPEGMRSADCGLSAGILAAGPDRKPTPFRA